MTNANVLYLSSLINSSSNQPTSLLFWKPTKLYSSFCRYVLFTACAVYKLHHSSTTHTHRLNIAQCSVWFSAKINNLISIALSLFLATMQLARPQILRLYKDLMLYSRRLTLTDPDYFKRRVVTEFKNNKALDKVEDITFAYQVMIH